ncbi:MAG: type II secretion system protein [Candidatus Omnitrophota bacterium]
MSALISKDFSLTVKYHRHVKGFTLLEIIVATLLFSLATAGMVSIFVGGKRQVMHVRDRTASSEMGKLFLDPLQLDVRQDTWGLGFAENALTVGTTYCDSDGGHTQNRSCPALTNRKLNNIEFSSTYTTDMVGTNLRRVKVKVNWTEN